MRYSGVIRDHIPARAMLVAGAVMAAATLLAALADPAAPYAIIGLAIAAAIALFASCYPSFCFEVVLLLGVLPFSGVAGAIYNFAFDYLLLICILCALWRAVAAREEAHVSAITICLVVFIAWATISLSWASDLVAGRQKLVAFGIAVALLQLCLAFIRSNHDLNRFMAVLSVAGWILAVAGIFTALFTDPRPGERLSVLGINQNLYSNALLTFLPGVLWTALVSEKRRRRIWIALGFLYVVLTINLVALAASRGAALSIIVILFVFLFSRPTRPVGLGGAVLASIGLIIDPASLQTLIQRFNGDEGDELGGRDLIWRAGFNLVRETFANGVGVGNGPASLTRYVAELTSDYNRRPRLASHNPFLEVLIELGFIGLFLFSLLFLIALLQFIKARTRGGTEKGVPDAYFPVIGACSIGIFLSIAKSGGMDTNPLTYVLLLFLILPGHINRQRRSAR